MEYFSFNDKEMSVQMNKLDTPYPWVNYLTNTRLTAMISQAGGGFLWYKVPAKMRITRYRYNQVPSDTPGFYIYIKDKSGKVWCPTFQPMNDKETERYSVHRPGETIFYAKNGKDEAILSMYIPPYHDVLVWELTVKNGGRCKKEYDVYAYAELSQFDWELEQKFGYYWQHMLSTKFDKEEQTLFYLYNRYSDDYLRKTSPLVYFASDMPVKSFCGDRDAFIGNYRNEMSPVGIECECLSNDEIQSGNPSAVLQVAVGCEAHGEARVNFFLGASEGVLVDYDKARENALKTIHQLRDKDFLAEQKKALYDRYEKHFSHFKCEIPDKTSERQINIWGPLNALQFSLLHQTPQPSAPGTRAIGIRDKAQALMPLVYRSPEGVKEGLLYLLSHQYVNGAISHGINGIMNEFGTPGKYRYESLKSDDNLWLPFLAYSVAAESGIEYLDEVIPFSDLEGNRADESGSVWEHLMRTIEFTQSHLGEHGLPLMLDGDWNDIISKFSKEGRGESVFAAEQYVASLGKMIEMAKALGKESDAEKLCEYKAQQIENIERSAWNGKWWYRCFDDNGMPIGAENDEFGKLWLNPQSWAVISGIGSNEQNDSAWSAVENMLDTGCGLQLLTPGFKTYPDVKEPFSPYNPGTGENGAIFCHAHTWSIIAEAKRRNAEKAWKYYTDLIPANLHKTLGTETYKSDPYGWVSNIVGPENSKHGWGNVIRLTGTCSWMNIAATQYLLGVRTTLAGVKLDPCIPAEWESFKVERDYLGTRLDITFKNPDRVSCGVVSYEIDGVEYKTNIIPKEILGGKDTVKVTVNMG
ncbi:MAG: hypothetical protein J6Q78_00425 [Clostridia bacterium]|nr:hypothetical protein [Clostridia bacterium]